MHIYFFTQHAEECGDGQGLSEFGIRTAISRGVTHKLETFSNEVKEAMEQFRASTRKTIYVSNDPKTWMTAVLMYYPYFLKGATPQLILKKSNLLDHNFREEELKQEDGLAYFNTFLQTYEIPMPDFEDEKDENQAEKGLNWGLEKFMKKHISEELVVCVTHHTTMQGFLSKKQLMDKSMYESFKSMWSMAVDCDKKTVEIQEGVKSSSKGNCFTII
jgi:hypothetical protein